MDATDLTALLLTRPAPAARRFAAQIRAASGFGGAVVISPVQRIVVVGAAGDLDDLPRDATLLLTSGSAVDAYIALGGPRGPRGPAAIAVGDATAAAAEAAGLPCRSAGGDAAALVRLVASVRPAGPVIHLRGVHVAGDLASDLRRAGVTVTSRVVYDQQAVPLSEAARTLLRIGGRVIAPLFSPRAARLLTVAVEAAGPVSARLWLPAISIAAARAWGGPGEIAIADAPDAASMVETIRNRLAR